MAKISELQLVQPNEAIDENGLIPVVVNTENNKKINKVIQTQKLADEIIEFTSSENGKLTQVLGEYTTKNELNEQLTQINNAIDLKANADHDHSGLYSEKTHTHNYVDLKGLPTLPSFTDEQFNQFCNRVEDMDTQITSMNLEVDGMNLEVDGLISDIQNIMLSLENIMVSLERNTNIKNSYILSVENIPLTFNLIQLKNITDGDYSFTATLDIIGENTDTGYCRYRAYLNCLNGTWKDAVITKVEGDANLDLILVCDLDNIIKLTCQSLFSNIYIDVICTQRMGTGSLEME